MHFTVVFNARESASAVADLVFTPSPVWLTAGDEIKLHPQVPTYRPRDLAALFAETSLEERLAEGARRAVVVVHGSGHGTDADLNALVSDLHDSGFEVETIAVGPDAV